MHCHNCGQSMDRSSLLCAKCGTPIGEESGDLTTISGSFNFTSLIRKGIRYGGALIGILFLLLTFWLLTEYLVSTLSISSSQTLSHGSELITIVYGVGSSVLTLVGLITIFVSINSQHRIQRCREVLWELMELPYQCWDERGNFVYNFSIEQGIRQRLIIYQRTLKSGVVFNHLIVSFLFVCIVVISIMYIVTIRVLKDSYFTSEGSYTFIYGVILLGVFLMLAFALLLLSLSRIRLIASLPNLADIMNANTQKSDIPSILLAAMCMRMLIRQDVTARFTFPFHKFTVFPWITGVMKETGEEVLLLGGPFEGNPDKEPLTHSFIDHERAHRLHFPLLSSMDHALYKEIVYKFELSSNQGTVYVEFVQDGSQPEEKEGRLHPATIIPQLKNENELFKELDFQ
ncbi:hypothetical protein Q75_01960 [Bacillus coahuilensis p1.1.43]|uniref:Zinc-ribbon domain-containing protein n=1 Tax=Bacillus coahuilensis p1.1.43 TaxID=1150625 RepID=A0A147KBT7_9BACI|nr:hypothetical protein [Bacillus coahuilensis]KUP08821.1 hypothetical protein Q75_01960 [Bacillus coahuilensis p1.1.43]